MGGMGRKHTWHGLDAQHHQVNRPAATGEREKEAAHRRVRLTEWNCLPCSNGIGCARLEVGPSPIAERRHHEGYYRRSRFGKERVYAARVDEHGRTVLRKTVRRAKLLELLGRCLFECTEDGIDARLIPGTLGL
jgi:hypothetical protein